MASSNAFYIPNADIVVTAEDGWLGFTKDAKNVSLSGTAFEGTALAAIVEQLIPEVQAYMQPIDGLIPELYLCILDEGTQLYDAYVYYKQDEESRRLWNLTQLSEEKRNNLLADFLQDNQGAAPFYHQVNGVQYLCVDISSPNENVPQALAGITINNGKTILVTICPEFATDNTHLSQMLYRVLNGVQYTKTEPMPLVLRLKNVLPSTRRVIVGGITVAIVLFFYGKRIARKEKKKISAYQKLCKEHTPKADETNDLHKFYS